MLGVLGRVPCGGQREHWAEVVYVVFHGETVGLEQGGKRPRPRPLPVPSEPHLIVLGCKVMIGPRHCCPTKRSVMNIYPDGGEAQRSIVCMVTTPLLGSGVFGGLLRHFRGFGAAAAIQNPDDIDKLSEGGVADTGSVSVPSYKRHRFPAEIIAHAVWLYFRFALSFRDIEEMLASRGVTVSYEAIRLWCGKFGPEYARRLRKCRRPLGRRWHVDEVFIRINGTTHYLWRA